MKKKIFVALVAALSLNSQAFAQFVPFAGCVNDIENSNLGSVHVNGTIDQSGLNPGGTPLQPCSVTLAQVNANFGGLILHSTSQSNNFWGQNFDWHSPTNIRYRVNGKAALSQILDGNFYWYTGEYGTANTIIPNFGNKPKISIANNGGLAIGTLYALSNTAPQGDLIVANNVGIGTSSPLARLHVDVTSRTPTNGIRFQGLPMGNDSTVLTVDPLGNVHQMPLPGSGGIVNNCAAIDFIPKTVSPTGDLDCSQIYDDGTSVGIGTTGPFGYMGAMVIGTTPPIGTPMTLDVNGMVRTTTLVVTSDANFKKNVTPLSNSLEKVLSLSAVEYNWKTQEYPNKRFDNLKHSGFLAQDLMKVLPNSVIKDVTGEYAVDYLSIIPVLTQAIQEQQKQIDELKALIKNSGAATNSDVLVKDGYLAQNVPNPFSVSTVIKYELPKGTQKGAIGVYDMNGREVKLFQLSNEKNGSISINGGDLMPGMYLYTLIINGQHFDSKKMILTSQ